ncbi:MAG: SurA N-terminal domain-containing protein [Wolbachia sp.]|nr:SurA N-terminal domain-containing protein [Wolbachia sp.]MDD9335985.1 SurA N-terminal domain-containing protein [Wolbachia sp.]
MFRALVLLLMWILPVTSFAADIEIIADVNGEPISNLDIEKRIKLVDSLFRKQNIDHKEVKPQILKQLIDEIIIINESKRLNIKLSDEELNNATQSFFIQNFKIKADEIDQYVKKHNINLNIFTRQIKCQLLWSKIIEARVLPFINISDKEVNDIKKQIGKTDYLITFQEVIVHNQKKNKDIAEDLVKKLRDNKDFIPEFPIKARKTTVSLNQLKGNLKGVLEGLEVGSVTDPISSSEGYSIIKVIEKIQLDHELLESTLRLRQVVVQDSENVLEDLRKQKVNCSNFDELASSLHLQNAKEFEIKMRDLNPELQLLFSKTSVKEIVEFREDNTARLMMLCNIKSNEVNTEIIKQQLFQQKIMMQSNLLFDDMRKNTAVSYRYS